MKKILFILSLLVLVGCSEVDLNASKPKFVEILEAEGYENIEQTGYDWLSCDEKDIFRDGFKATKNGRNVKGVVCSSFLKGYTIRFTKL